jgi:hypothetical protein
VACAASLIASDAPASVGASSDASIEASGAASLGLASVAEPLEEPDVLEPDDPEDAPEDEDALDPLPLLPAPLDDDPLPDDEALSKTDPSVDEPELPDELAPAPLEELESGDAIDPDEPPLDASMLPASGSAHMHAPSELPARSHTWYPVQPAAPVQATEAPGVHTGDGGETDEPLHMTREAIDKRIATKEPTRGQPRIVSVYIRRSGVGASRRKIGRPREAEGTSIHTWAWPPDLHVE